MLPLYLTEGTYKTKGIHARAIHPDLVPRGGEPPKSSLGQ